MLVVESCCSCSILFVIQSEAKNLEDIKVDAFEILPPFGRQNDNHIFSFFEANVHHLIEFIPIFAH